MFQFLLFVPSWCQVWIVFMGSLMMICLSKNLVPWLQPQPTSQLGFDLVARGSGPAREGPARHPGHWQGSHPRGSAESAAGPVESRNGAPLCPGNQLADHAVSWRQPGGGEEIAGLSSGLPYGCSCS